MSLYDRSFCSFFCSGFSTCRTQELVCIAAQGTKRFGSKASPGSFPLPLTATLPPRRAPLERKRCEPISDRPQRRSYTQP